jgi:DNA mismatch endonuclease (patch repair protein)
MKQIQCRNGLPGAMADRLTIEQRRLNMSRIRGKHTAPELAVRQILHRGGFRYRLHRRDLPGKPDVVLPRYRAAILINGCFWHGHDCSLFRTPTTRAAFWNDKIEKNRRRDAIAVQRLTELGWRTLCVWECAIKGRKRLPDAELARRMVAFVTGEELTDEIAGERSADVQDRESH